MEKVINRTCIAGWMLSKQYQQTIGIVITASHNPESYNGVKIISPNGEGLSKIDERFVEEIVNLTNKDFKQKVKDYMAINNNFKGMILLGRDTRSSGKKIVEKFLNYNYSFLKANVIDLGITTTPQIHFEVKNNNENNYKCFYMKWFTHYPNTTMYIDTANGAASMFFDSDICKKYNFIVLNNHYGKINDNCGTEHFLKTGQLPNNKSTSIYRPCAIFDGDADRLALLSKDGYILDGTDLALIIYEILYTKLVEANIHNKLNVGIIVSHYSNGSVYNYLKEKQIPFSIVGAGVKHFLNKSKSYDISVWFEPNGHGGITFSKKATDLILNSGNKNLIKIYTIYNKTIGDALANLFLIREFNFNCVKQYVQMPSKLGSVIIKDKTMIKIDEDTYTVISPVALSNLLKKINTTNNKDNTRAFVRPSGTENIIRIYVESNNQAIVDKIYDELKNHITYYNNLYINKIY